jgi:prepilin signal peptidase PulO-like enzyme (type II secretory pathway)
VDLVLLLSIFLLLLALLLGSFTNVLIHRIPKGESIVLPCSYCFDTKKPLKWYENIPLLSYIFLKGKSSYSKKKIPLSYPLVELALTLFSIPFIYEFYIGNLHPLLNMAFLEVVFIEIFLSITLALAVIDSKTQELPHELTYSGIIIGIIYSFIFAKGIEAVAAIGAMFFIFDFTTHFANKIYYKKKALEISPAALALRINFLHKNITWLYLGFTLLCSYLLFTNYSPYIKYVFLYLGIMYIVNDIFVDFFFMSSKDRNKAYSEANTNEMTVMGGGDAAMAAFIASIFASINVSLSIVWLGFVVALVAVIFNKLIHAKKGSLSERVAFGNSLAVALIAAMILRSVLNFEFRLF